nr:MAG TPA: hypothetical protein [Bacteriophage sp.]
MDTMGVSRKESEVANIGYLISFFYFFFTMK